jgi:conjugal transfer mating pair stabilization protein TraN
MRKIVTVITLFCFICTRMLAVAGPSDEGFANGNAANPIISGNISAPNAAAVVPGYTTTPPETAYYGSASLTGKANARLVACALTPHDPVCQAQAGATNSANTPRPPVGFYDPTVMSAHDVTRNPSNTLGDISSYYSGCTTTNTAIPTTNKKRLCHRY